MAATFSSGGEVLYVADSGTSGGVSVVGRYDGKTLDRWVLGRGVIPLDLTRLQDGRVLLVTFGRAPGTDGRGGVSIVSTRDLTELGRLEACADHPEGVAAMGDGRRAYVRCGGTGPALVELDLELRRVVRSTPLAGLPPNPRAAGQPSCGGGGVALSRTDGFLLLPCSESGRLVYFDRLTLEPVDSLPVGPGIDRIAVSRRDPIALLASEDRPEVQLVDLGQRTVDATIQLSRPARSLAISGDGRWAFLTVGDDRNGSLVRLSLKSSRVVSRTPVTGAGGISLWPGRSSPVMIWRPLHRQSRGKEASPGP
jgi:DNA-binding beta-propeller fold protein YncE